MIRPLMRWWNFQLSRWRRFWSSLTLGRLTRRAVGVFEWLWWLIRYPFVMLTRFLGMIWSGIRAAWTQKHIRYFLQGLPALIAILALCVTSAFAYLRAGEGLVDLYSKEGMIAQYGQNIPKAKLCYERLAQLNPRDPDVRYNLAVTLEADNNRDYAQTLMAELAPLDRGGFALAHLWEAKRLLYKSPPNNSQQMRENMEKAEIHLRRSLNPAAVPPLKDQMAVEARGLLGRVYLAMGKPAEAEPYLAAAAPSLPDLRLNLAELYKSRGRNDLAKEQCRLAVEYFKTAAEQNVDFVQARVQWARALAQMGEFQEAVDVLTRGKALSTNEGYRVMLSDVYVKWAADVREKNPAALSEYLNRLELALVENPLNPQAIGLLVDLNRNKTPEGLRAQQQLRTLLTQNKSALLHFAVGVIAYEDGNMEDALFHWEAAYKISYDMAIVGNNVAWMLATVKERQDLPRALEIINGVIKANPNIGIFHGTRGYIYYQQGKFKEAIADLEQSLQDNTLNPQLHEFLAGCYQSIGNKAMADEHLKQKRIKEQKIQESGAKKIGK